MAIAYVPLDSRHLNGFVDLFEREKGEVRTHLRPQYLPWAFQQNPMANTGTITMEVAEEDGRIVGAMGAVPQVILDRGRAIPAAFFVDWLVDSRQRRRRIGSTLINNAVKRFPVAVHLGSTREGYATCATLGALDCGRTIKGRRILNPWRWSRGARNDSLLVRAVWSAAQTARLWRQPRLTSTFSARPIYPHEFDSDQFNTALHALSHALSQTHVCTLRTAKRWRWLLDSPLYTGYALEVTDGNRRLGYAALVLGYRSQRLVGTVADICIGAIEDGVPVLETAISDLARRAVDGITFNISAEIAARVIARNDFLQDGDPMMGTWLHPGYDDLLERSWFMTMGENLSVAAGIDYPVRVPELAL